MQRVNYLSNNIFVNLPPLPLLCEISEVLHVAQPGLMASRWEAVRRNTGEFEIFKVDLTNPFQLLFWIFNVHDMHIHTHTHLGVHSKFCLCKFVIWYV